MKTILDRYLDRVLVYANKPAAKAEVIRRELKDHLLQKVEDLAAAGLPREEAVLEALRLHGPPKTIGYRLRDPFPWFDIRTHGTARGVIAIGPRAIGVVACGGVALGVFTCGGLTMGLFSVGGIALGLLFAWGGFALGTYALGGMALGLIAVGGMAVGAVAVGGLGIGLWVPDAGTAISHYTRASAPHLLKSLEPLLNSNPLTNGKYGWIVWPLYVLVIFSMVFLQYREHKRIRSEEDWLLDG